MLVPILFALSDMSVMAISATSAAAFVSPERLCNNDAEKLVTFCIYSLADIPAVLYALFAFAITTSALSLNSVSTPPMFCSRLATESSDAFVVAAKAAVIPAAKLPTTASPPFAILPILLIPELKPPESILVSNFKEPS